MEKTGTEGFSIASPPSNIGYNEKRMKDPGSSLEHQSRMSKTCFAVFGLFQELKRKHGVTDQNVYIVADHGYALSIDVGSKSQDMPRPKTVHAQKQTCPGMAPVMLCSVPNGRFLDPYAIFKSGVVAGPNSQGDVQVPFAQTGWPDATHLRDCIFQVFEPATNPGASRGAKGPPRLLLIDGWRLRLDITKGFFVTCCLRGIIPLCIPRETGKFLNPLEFGIVPLLNNIYTDEMKKRRGNRRRGSPGKTDNLLNSSTKPCGAGCVRANPKKHGRKLVSFPTMTDLCADWSLATSSLQPSTSQELLMSRE